MGGATPHHAQQAEQNHQAANDLLFFVAIDVRDGDLLATRRAGAKTGSSFRAEFIAFDSFASAFGAKHGELLRWFDYSAGRGRVKQEQALQEFNPATSHLAVSSGIAWPAHFLGTVFLPGGTPANGVPA